METSNGINPPVRQDLDGPGSSATAARDRAGEAAQEARSEVAAVAHDVVDQASTVARDAGEGVSDVIDEARRVVHDEADKQAHVLSESMRQLGNDLADMARQADDTTAADYVGRIGGSLESVASRLDEGGIDGALDQIRTIARRRPGMFLAGSAMSGFAVARVMRHASAPSRSQTGTSQVGASAASERSQPALQSPSAPSTSTSDGASDVDLRDQYRDRPGEAPQLREDMQEWARP